MQWMILEFMTPAKLKEQCYAHHSHLMRLMLHQFDAISDQYRFESGKIGCTTLITIIIEEPNPCARLGSSSWWR